jgi:hypothetical protein
MKSIILALLVWGQDIVVKPTYETAVGEFLVVNVESKGHKINWVPLGEGGLQILNSNLLKDPKSLVVVANKAGTYKILAYTAIDNNPSEPVIFSIIAGGPPKPIPNELESIINATYGADNNPNKSQYKSKLITGFTNVLDGLVGCKTVGDLNKLMKDKVTSKLVDGEGGAVRSVLRDHLSDTFGINGDVILEEELATKVILNILNILKRL